MASITTTGIISVGTCFLEVDDQDAALEFYRDKMGFEVRTDTQYGEGFRWVEVAPPGAKTVVALNVPREGQEPKRGDTMFGYDAEDVQATWEELKSRGVEVEDMMDFPPPVPPMFYFTDPFGNRTLIVKRDD
jgi:catechol 2,3-dioxygenase-like lactoylglutathione lyase family enzyme